MPSVLICDDSIAVHESISVYLKEYGIGVSSAFDGETALDRLRGGGVDLVILDLMLPGRFGTEVLQELRRFSDVPVLILSAKSSEVDRILGLELGADDYVVKPFSPKEVAVRVRTILRRSGKTQERGAKYRFAGLLVDRSAYRAEVGGVPLELTPKELEVLAFFAENPGIVLSRERIMNAIWGYEYYNDTRAVDTQILRLRQKLPQNADFSIASVYGVGYRLEKK